jgi:hypothetical protein
MAVCCQNLTPGALRSRITLSVLVGALFKEFGLFLIMPRISEIRRNAALPLLSLTAFFSAVIRNGWEPSDYLLYHKVKHS